MGSPDRKDHRYGRGCLVNGIVALSMIGAVTGLCSQMSFENYRKRTFPDSTRAIVIQTPLPISRATAPTEIPPTDCTKYPPLLRHRASACVADDCDGWTFFGKKEGAFPERVVSRITCSDPAASQVHAS